MSQGGGVPRLIGPRPGPGPWWFPLPPEVLTTLRNSGYADSLADGGLLVGGQDVGGVWTPELVDRDALRTLAPDANIDAIMEITPDGGGVDLDGLGGESLGGGEMAQ